MIACPSQYAATHVVNPETGRRLFFKAHAYLREPLDRLDPRVIVQKGAQVGATVLAMVRALFMVDVCQAHTLYLFPTHRSALRFSRGRLAVLLDASRHLASLFRRQRNAAHLRAGRINLYCHGGRSRPELMSLPAQALIIDERDEMYQADPFGRQPWSAVELARQRLAGQDPNWELDLSTPTLPGCGIAADYAASDQRIYMVKCPRCGRGVSLSWPDSLCWSEANAERRPPSYRCAACKGLWREAERRAAVRSGFWTPRRRGGAARGYWIPRLLAPKLTADRLVREWRAAQGAEGKLQVFHNAVLGLPYLPESGRLRRAELVAAMTASPFVMAAGSTTPCVMGADVGPAWLHVVILEAGPPRPRALWIGKTPGWNELAKLLQRYTVRAFVLDAQPETHRAREFVRRHRQGFLCYYRGDAEPNLDAARQTLWAARTGSLDETFGRLRRCDLLLPRDAPAEFLQQLESPVRLLRRGRDGELRAVYQEAGGPDHYAHALNYALLALKLLARPPSFSVTESKGLQLAWE
jgi:hypothetical protein